MIKKNFLNEKLKRVLIGNEATLILLPLGWLSTRIEIFVDDYETYVLSMFNIIE